MLFYILIIALVVSEYMYVDKMDVQVLVDSYTYEVKVMIQLGILAALVFTFSSPKVALAPASALPSGFAY